MYPPESFARTVKYGIPMLITEDEGLKKYLDSVSAQLKSKTSILCIIIHSLGGVCAQNIFIVRRWLRPHVQSINQDPNGKTNP